MATISNNNGFSPVDRQSVYSLSQQLEAAENIKRRVQGWNSLVGSGGAAICVWFISYRLLEWTAFISDCQFCHHQSVNSNQRAQWPHMHSDVYGSRLQSPQSTVCCWVLCAKMRIYGGNRGCAGSRDTLITARKMEAAIPQVPGRVLIQLRGSYFIA